MRGRSLRRGRRSPSADGSFPALSSPQPKGQDALTCWGKRHGEWRLPDRPTREDVAMEWNQLVEPALKVQQKLHDNLLFDAIWDHGLPVAVRREKARVFSGCKSRPDNWSLHPVAIGAAVEATKPSKPSRQRAALGGSASRQAATQVNAGQASKQGDVGADPVATRGRPPSLGTEGSTPHDATRPKGPTGVWAVACLHTEIRSNTGSPRRCGFIPQPESREGQAGPPGVADGFVVPRKPGIASQESNARPRPYFSWRIVAILRTLLS
jgi:hypothetical protein